MGLFSFNYDRPGPGVPDGAPRLTGIRRIWEMISRDFKAFWLAGLMNFAMLLPFLLIIGLACATHSLLFALISGVIGGLAAAPGFYGLADTLLRSLRDEPGFWWFRCSRAMKKGWKSTLVPGALFGTVFSLQIFISAHMHLLGGGIGLLLCHIISMLVSLGLFIWFLPQHVLMELRGGSLLKNSLLLYGRYLLKTLGVSLLMLLFILAAVLFFPASAFLLLLTGLWLPLLCALQVIYPLLDENFDIEISLKENH